ncbi:MAG: dGTPase [Rhodospirillaceae bacterium]|nr:MAG: dGTPase [Rhodospirillaceae bacterium]
MSGSWVLPRRRKTGSVPPMTSPLLLAPYACHPDQSRGRLHDEPKCLVRSPFQRDRDRIVHSAAFRRLKHKTQVFVSHEGDHYRTRLTHSLEVSQIARSVCRALGLNEDLAEALALAHDLGHTPFGHAGEDALQTCMAPYGGFDHNAQALRLVTRLEHRYAAFDGLNLTWETLEGMVKHNGPVQTGTVLPAVIRDDAHLRDLELDTWPSLEAQVVALADDIAYDTHDLDDGLRAGLFTIDALKTIPLAEEALAAVDRRHPGLEWSRRVHESVRRLIAAMVTDLLEETKSRLAVARPDSPDAVRRLGRPLAGFSDAMRAHDATFKAFLFPNMYRHDMVNRMTHTAQKVVTDLFDTFVSDPRLLPEDWQRQVDGTHTPATARLVADYIAGMTDRYAIKEHARLLNPGMPP